MREILFRGKSVDSDEWVYGSLVYCPADDEQASIVVFEEEDEGGFIFGNHNDVHLKTVGQYTGLKDRNGVKIFEGDIVRDDFGCIDKVTFIYGRYTPFNMYPEYKCWLLGTSEVIGNIHDNPELLEGRR